MPVWNHKIAIRHLMTQESDPESVKKSMNAIADVLVKDKHFDEFFQELDGGVEEWRAIDDIEEANSILTNFWDYCDANRIWVEF